ncbi:HET-domain-containing protein, partial [Mollisia scopiformis]
LNQDWIDLELIKQWTAQCVNQHGRKCDSPLKTPHVAPAWLIDTVSMCMVSGESISEFVALSYRWGSSSGFRTTTDILEDLKKQGALMQTRFADKIPPSIKHAIGLVSAVSERYLWVDSICIVQDDEVQLGQQLELMGLIYASAKITIVATNGDATDGICGLNGISPHRRLDQKSFSVFENEQVILSNNPDFRSGLSPYFDRGWTFQEFYLSKRRLIFADRSIHWQCWHATWHEDLIDDSSHDVYRESDFLQFRNILDGQPDFDRLGRLLTEYNDLEFTYPEDALPGITGLLNILSRSFEGGFLYGLPETCFDSALMWCRMMPSDLDRRTNSGKSRPLPGSHLPSWSWVGWKGFGISIIKEESFASAQRYARTTPITQWYTHETPHSETKRAIRSTWLETLQNLNKAESCLAQGWIQETYNKEIHGPDVGLPPTGLVQYIYRHSTIPDRYFWQPVFIGKVENQVSRYNVLQTPYISCHTKRAWLTAHRFAMSNFTDHDITYHQHLMNVRLANQKNGKYCGTLILHTEDDISYFSEADSEETLEIEIVAICRQELSFFEMRFDMEKEERIGKHVYAVLWVEWIDGVAYRRASGYIKKERWEEHELEDVHLVLG